MRLRIFASAIDIFQFLRNYLYMPTYARIHSLNISLSYELLDRGVELIS